MSAVEAKPEATVVARLKKTITEFLERHPGSTFAELCREVPDFAGNATLGTSYQNLILWRGVSESAVRALELLEKGRVVRFEAATHHPYGEDGRRLGLPVALRPQDYPRPHWLPVLLHATRKSRRA